MASRLSRTGSETARFVAPARATESEVRDPEERVRAAEEEARARGLAAGLEEGRRRARTETEAHLRTLAASVEATAGLRVRLVREAERELLDLAVKIAEKVVRGTIATDAEVVTRALAAALDEIPRDEPCSVRCHPGDEALVTAFLARPPASSVSCAVRPDPALEPGGVVVESGAGDIDVRIATQLRVLEHELLSRT